ncbi:hypothetical protein [Nostoc sp. MG11]|uniref:hypothetical protein n=1 Tax=Nostoc sp. MG11 TaxID=2721166 RepID=UPI0018696DB5|nr:hypothetical protein [Nostoc sp. MG11]
MSGLGFTRWGALVTIAFGVSFCTVCYASANVTGSTSVQGNAGNITIIERNTNIDFVNA